MEPIDGSDIEQMLGFSAMSARALVAGATETVVRRLGERGSCVLVTPEARVVLSTEFPASTDFPIDLERYPEVRAALSSGDAMVIEDVRTSAVLASVADLLPARLGAVAVIPLVAQQRCLGVIIAQSSSPRPMADRDVAAAQLVGKLAGTLLELRFGTELAAELGCAAGLSLLASATVTAGPHSGSQATPPPNADSGAQRNRRRLLIADDDTEDASWLAELLAEEGFEVTCAANGADAIYQAKKNPPDLILLDVHMPVMDGFAAAAELAQDARTVSIPILFLSGSEDLMSRVRNFDRESVDFLRKPCSFLELVARIEKSLKQADSRQHLRLDANLDELTGLGNLRCLREHIEKEQSRMGRTGSSLAIVMIDVDKLKRINDEHGHLIGSKVLKAIGETLRAEIRPTDLAIRYGGDEFVVLLPHTRQEEGVAFAERLLARMNALCPEGIPITLSMGVAALDRSAGLSVDGLLAWADAAAYRAKHLGGNRVCKHGDDGPLVTETAAPPTRDVRNLEQ